MTDKIKPLNKGKLNALSTWSFENKGDNELADAYLEACSLLGHLRTNEDEMAARMYEIGAWPHTSKQFTLPLRKINTVLETAVSCRDGIGRLIIMALKSEYKQIKKEAQKAEQ
jgi:hypothetical protein